MTKDARARYTLRLPQDLFELVGKEASSRGVPMNALILQILWEWSERQAKKQRNT